jgi:hypothetical protein
LKANVDVPMNLAISSIQNLLAYIYYFLEITMIVFIIQMPNIKVHGFINFIDIMIRLAVIRLMVVILAYEYIQRVVNVKFLNFIEKYLNIATKY